MTKQEIIEKVNQILIRDFELSPETITPEANLKEELGLDSLDGVDLVVAMEKTFQIKIEESEARQIDTVGRIYQQIDEKIKDR